MIAEVYWWIDRAWVSVLDERGHLMPAYSGPLDEVSELIVRDAPHRTKFYQAALALGWRTPIARENMAAR